MNRDTTALHAARRRQAQDCHRRALEAIRHLNATRQPVTFASVARQAEVSRRFLYTTEDLAARIRSARSGPRLTSAPPPPVPGRSTNTGEPALESAAVAALRHQIRRLESEHKQQVSVLTARVNELARENAALLGQLISTPTAPGTQPVPATAPVITPFDSSTHTTGGTTR